MYDELMQARNVVYARDIASAAVKVEEAKAELHRLVILASRDGMSRRAVSSAAGKSPAWSQWVLRNYGTKTP